MVSNQLDDRGLNLFSRSAVLDKGSDTLAIASVSILYTVDQVHIKKAGRYRFDSEPPQLKVERGDAEVTADGKSIEAGEGFVVPSEGKLTARELLSDSDVNPADDLDNWSAARDNSVTENNRNAAAAADLSGVIDGWQNDPDAVLQSLGVPPYYPGMSSMVPPPGYGAYGYGAYGYGSGLYGPGNGLYSSGLYGQALWFGLTPA